jgi:hypothetical protein
MLWLACAPMKRSWDFSADDLDTPVVHLHVVRAEVKQKDAIVEVRIRNPSDERLKVRLSQGSLRAPDGQSWPAFSATSGPGRSLALVGIQARKQELVLPPKSNDTFLVRAHQYGLDLRRYPQLELELRLTAKDQLLEPVLVLSAPAEAPRGQHI